MWGSDTHRDFKTAPMTVKATTTKVITLPYTTSRITPRWARTGSRSFPGPGSRSLQTRPQPFARHASSGIIERSRANVPAPQMRSTT
jgi:hypothetical protein